MADPIQQLIDSRANTWESYKGFIADTAKASADEKRDMTADEAAKDEAFRKELDTLDARIDELTGIQARAARLDRQRAEYESALHRDVEKDEKTTAEKEAALLRAFLSGETRKFAVSLSGMTTRNDPRTGGYEVRDLVQITAAAGGNTVPTAFRNQLYEHLVANSAIRQTNVTVITTDSAENIQIPKTASLGTAALVGEGTAFGEVDPTFGQVTLAAWDYGQLLQVTNKLLNSTGVDLVGFIARDTGRALGAASGAHFITGTGTTMPIGVMVGCGTGVTGGTGVVGVPTAANLVDLFYSVNDSYARNGYWLMARATEGKIRQITDSYGQFLWQPGLQVGTPNMLLGRPVVSDPNVAATGTNNLSVAFGDFSAYFIRDVSGVQFARSDDFAFSANLVTYRAILQTDGALVDLTGAIKAFKGGTA